MNLNPKHNKLMKTFENLQKSMNELVIANNVLAEVIGSV